MERSLLQTFDAAQQGEKSEILFIVEKFDLLISKYARKLSYEDGKNELVFLCRTLCRINLIMEAFVPLYSI